jgi:integrase
MKRSEVPFDLPKGVRPKHGALYLIEGVKVASKWTYRWHRLCAIAEGEAAMYTALGKAKAPAHRGNFRAAIDRFKLQYLSARSHSSRKEVERMLDRITGAFEDFNVDQPEAADVIDFTDQFKHAPAAARHYKALLSTFFRWSIGKRMRVDNPCREIWLAKSPRKKLVWTPEIFNKVRDALLKLNSKNIPQSAGVMLQCYMDLSFLIYQRTTDIRLLERAQLRDSVIYFQPTKTRESSGVELEVERTPEINAVLERAAAESKRMNVVCRYVIHTSGGTAYTRSGIYSAIMRAAKSRGIAGVNPKALRPFAATQAKKQGYSLEEIQDGLGHASITTTEGYVRKNEVRRSKVRLTLPLG